MVDLKDLYFGGMHRTVKEKVAEKGPRTTMLAALSSKER